MIVPSGTANSEQELCGAAEMDSDSTQCFRMTCQWYPPRPSADNGYVKHPPTHIRLHRIESHIPLFSDVISRGCRGGDFVTQAASRYALDGTARSVRIWRWMSVSSGSKRRISSVLWRSTERVVWLKRRR